MGLRGLNFFERQNVNRPSKSIRQLSMRLPAHPSVLALYQCGVSHDNAQSTHRFQTVRTLSDATTLV